MSLYTNASTACRFRLYIFVDKATGVLIGYKWILIISMITATTVVTVN